MTLPDPTRIDVRPILTAEELGQAYRSARKLIPQAERIDVTESISYGVGYFGDEPRACRFLFISAILFGEHVTETGQDVEEIIARLRLRAEEKLAAMQRLLERYVAAHEPVDQASGLRTRVGEATVHWTNDAALAACGAVTGRVTAIEQNVTCEVCRKQHNLKCAQAQNEAAHAEASKP